VLQHAPYSFRTLTGPSGAIAYLRANFFTNAGQNQALSYSLLVGGSNRTLTGIILHCLPGLYGPGTDIHSRGILFVNDAFRASPVGDISPHDFRLAPHVTGDITAISPTSPITALNPLANMGIDRGLFGARYQSIVMQNGRILADRRDPNQQLTFPGLPITTTTNPKDDLQVSGQGRNTQSTWRVPDRHRQRMRRHRRLPAAGRADFDVWPLGPVPRCRHDLLHDRHLGLWRCTASVPCRLSGPLPLWSGTSWLGLRYNCQDRSPLGNLQTLLSVIGEGTQAATGGAHVRPYVYDGPRRSIQSAPLTIPTPTLERLFAPAGR
jgi:hypothetical protein